MKPHHHHPHVYSPSEGDPEEEDDDDDNDTGRISLSTATTTTTTTTNDPGGREEEDRWDPLDLQDDPSFEGLLTRPGQTSTPQKAPGINTDQVLVDQDEEPSSEGGDEWLRGDGIRLTRQRLANLPLVVEQAQRRTHPSASMTNTRIPNGALSSPMYAPSPSTGSSTLVDPREDEVDLMMARRRLKEKARAGREQGHEMTIRHANGVTTLREEAEDEEEEARTEIATPRTRPNNEHQDQSPSPPRPFSNPTPRRRGAPLESYVQSHTTPRYTTSRTSPLPTATPLVPGSFPPIPSRPPLTSQPSSTPLPRHTGRAQILDAFNRFIQGPNGALTLSAERRAALTRKNVRAEAEAREVLMRSKTSSVGSSELKRSTSKMRTVKGTPHPTGWYAFEPRAIENAETEASSPSVRNGRGDAQDREAQPTSKLFTNTRFTTQDFVEDEGDRSRGRNPRTQEYESDDSAQEEEDDVEQEEGEEEEAAYRATGGGRSAIEYAMAKSFIASPVKAKPRVSSPPQSTIPPRPMTPPSPTLPELPPVPPIPPTPSPQSSPTARRRRTPLTTQTNSSSSAAATPSFRSLTKKVPQSSTPPRSPPPLPGTTQPDHPRSSTPPRNTRFIPPSPSRTPLSKRSSTTPPSSSKKPTPKLAFVSPSKSPVNSPPPRVTYQVQERSFPNEKEEEIDPSRDDDQHLLELVEELARIVRSRSIESSREESGEDLEEGGRGFYDEENAALLRRNEDVLREAEECVREGRDLEAQLREEEKEGKMNEVSHLTFMTGITVRLLMIPPYQATIKTLLQRLDEAETIDESLLSRMDGLRSTLDTLGRDLGAQVSLAVQKKLEEEASQRGNWLMWGVACQFVLIWVVMCLANYRASRLYDSSFIDPFTHPALYYISPSTTTHHISEETLALFSPVPKRGRGAGQGGLNYVVLVMRKLMGGIGRGQKGFGFGMRGMGTGRGVVERVPF